MAPPKRPWFRFYVEAVTDRKMRRLTPAERWLWVAVLGAARHSPEPGVLLVVEDDPMTLNDLADWAGMTLREVTAGIGKMRRLGMVADRDDGAITVPKWDERQHASDDVTARTRKHRSKGKPPDDEPPPMERSIDDRRNGDSPPPENVPGTHQKTDTDTDTSSSVVTRTGSAEPEDDDDHRPPGPIHAAAQVLGDQDHQRRLAARRPGLDPIGDPAAHRAKCVERWLGDQRLLDAARQAFTQREPVDGQALADRVRPPTLPAADERPHPALRARPACTRCDGTGVYELPGGSFDFCDHEPAARPDLRVVGA